MDETQYHAALDAIFQQIEAALEAADADLDYDVVGGILTIEGVGGKLIVSRQPPLRELWVAAKSGGFHFRKTATEWVDTRDGTPLKARLEALLQAIAGIAIRLDRAAL